MRQRRAVALAVTVISLAVAQDFSGQPECAIPCLTEFIPEAGCEITDISCQCDPVNQSNLLPLIQGCLLNSCNPADLARAAAAASSQCAAFQASATSTPSPSPSPSTTSTLSEDSVSNTARPTTTADTTDSSTTTTSSSTITSDTPDNTASSTGASDTGTSTNGNGSSNNSSNDLNPTAIGLGVGIGVGGLGIALAAFFLIRRYRKGRVKPTNNGNGLESDGRFAAAASDGLTASAVVEKSELPASAPGFVSEVSGTPVDDRTGRRSEAPPNERRHEMGTGQGTQGRHELW